MKKLPILCFFIALTINLIAQTDSTVRMVQYNSSYEFKEGIYLNINQLKTNSPIPKFRIVSTSDYSAIDFFENVLAEENITIYDDLGMQQQIATKNIWGYSKNRNLYINWNGEFNRIPVIGSVCHFVANKVFYHQSAHSVYDPYYNRYVTNPSNTSVELVQYLLDIETEAVYEFDENSVEVILIRDAELYDEYMDLRKKKRRQMKFQYIRKYNEAHPLLLPAE